MTSLANIGALLAFPSSIKGIGVTQRMSEGILHFGTHAKMQPSPGQRTGAVYTIQGFHHLAAWSP